MQQGFTGVNDLFLRLSLLCNCLNLFFYFFRVAQKVMFYWLQSVIELVNEGSTIRNVELHNLFIMHIVNMLYQSSQTIPAGGNKDFFSCFKRRHNFIFPIWHNALYGVF